MSSLYEKSLKPRKTLNSHPHNRGQGSEVIELRRMVQHFRVSELQEFLQAFGHTRTGKKQILQSRAFSLISKNINTVRSKINEINSRPHNYSNMAYTIHPVKQTPPEIPIMNSNASSSYIHTNSLIQQETPQTQYQTPSLHSSHPQPAVLHPDVRFVKPTFFEELHVLIRPTSLAAIAKKNYPGNQGIHHESTLKFALSPQQLNHIKAKTIELEDNLHMGSDVKQVQTKFEVQLRFCLQETSCDQIDNFPINMHIKVNHKYIQVNGYHPGLSNRPEYKRTGRPVDITSHCRNVPPSEVNLVQIYWTPDLYNIPTGHVIMCSLVKTIDSSQLLIQLKAKAVRSADHSRALIKEKFKMSDCEVSATSYRVSLLCPLGKVKMNYPCRARSCSHLQCFDAELYLQMNEKKSTWICPICDRSSQFSDLILDDLFSEILQQARGFEEIEFDQDGSWYSISEKGEKGKKMTTLFPTPLAFTPSKLPIVLDLSPSSDSKSPLENTRSDSDSPSPAPTLPVEKSANFIDLTLDSESESENDIPTSTVVSTIPPTIYHHTTPQTNHIRFDSPSFMDLHSSISTDTSHSNVSYLSPHQMTSSIPLNNTHIITRCTPQHSITSKQTGSQARMHPTSPHHANKRHKPYHSTNTFLSSLPNTLSHKTHSPQIQTQQRSPDSTTDTSNVTYLHYPASGTYLQVPIPIEQSTAESLSSSHSSQHSGGSPHQTIAYALPTNLGYGYQAVIPLSNLDGQSLDAVNGLDLVGILQGDYLNTVPQNFNESISPSILQQENIIFNDPQLTTNPGHIYTTHYQHHGLLEDDNDQTQIVRLQIPSEVYDDSNSAGSIIAIDCPSN